MKTATSFTPTRPTRAALITWSAPTIFSISCRKAATRTRIQRWIGCGGTTSTWLKEQARNMTTKAEAKNQIGQEFIITREFDAPRELVWKACTEAKQVRSEEHTSELQSRENLVCR